MPIIFNSYRPMIQRTRNGRANFIMRKEFVLYVSIGWVLVIASCARIEEQSVNNTAVFYAEVPIKDKNEKTYIDGNWNMYWHSGDKISVFQSAVNEKYKFAGETGEIINEFHKDDSSVPGECFQRNYAIYPFYSEATCSSEGEIKTCFPSVQYYAFDSFGQDANTMIAVTRQREDNVFYFKNVCGYLKLKIYGGDHIRKIVLRGNNGEKLAGQASITAEYDKAPETQMSDSAGTEIILDCGEKGVATGMTSEECTSFWIAVPPTTFSKGFTVEITNTVNITKRQTTEKRITVSQNKVKQMSAIEFATQNSPMFYSFSISDGACTYKAFDISAEFVNIMVPNHSDLSHMTASFTYRGISVKEGGTEQISGEGVKDFNNFAKPVEYVITSADKSSQTVKIRIFDLPVLVIDTPDHISITSKDYWIENATIKLRNTDNIETDLGLTAIKGRGNLTWRSFPKKPYSIKLDSKASFFGLPKHKRWCLLANYMDKTLMRNSVSYEIGRNCDGLSWTPGGDFVEVILNEKHIGNYYLCEQIKIDENRINISKDNGFIITADNTWDEQYKFKSKVRELPYMFKDPDVVTDEQFNKIESYVNEMEESLYNDEKFAERDYLNYLDVNSLIDFWFVYELAMNHEPLGPRSVFMYKDGDGVFYSGPVWDFDMLTYIPSRVNSWQIKTVAMYYPRLFQDANFKNEVYLRWIKQKDKFLAIQSFIDLKTYQIKASESRDRTIWSFSDNSNGEQGLTYDQAVERMRKAYLDKLDWMDKQIKNMPTQSYQEGTNEDYDNREEETNNFNFGF